MLTFLALIHIFIAIALIVFVLLQDPKDGAAGIFGGGSSSSSFFGASGANNFLTITTKWLAGLFAISCLILTSLSSKKSNSVLDQPDGSAPMSAPAAPAVPGANAPAGTTAPANPDGAAPAANGAASAPANAAAPAAPAPEKK